MTNKTTKRNIDGEEKNRQDRDCIPGGIEKAIAKKLLTKKKQKKLLKNQLLILRMPLNLLKESPVPRPEALYEDVFAD